MFREWRINGIKKLIDINEYLFFERKLRNFYNKVEKINLIIDVGANKGQTIDFFLKINPKCEIYAIEPNPRLFLYLKDKFKNYSHVKIFNLGISNKSGTKKFYENVFDYTSTFEELNLSSKYLNNKARILGIERENIIKSIYPVVVNSLSEFVNSNIDNKQIDVLKIDTEGHEYYCLEGLFNTDVTNKIKFIQIEYHNDDLYKNRIDFSIINKLLVENNYFEYIRIKHGFGDFYEIIYSDKG